MLCRHVLLGGSRAAAGARAHVHGNAHPPVVDLDGASVEAQLHLLAREVVRHRVVVTLELDVVVDVHRGQLARAMSVRLRRQGPQERCLAVREDART